MNTYLSSLEKASQKALLVDQQKLSKDILKAYRDAGMQLSEKFKMTKEGSATRAYYADYMRNLNKSINSIIEEHGLKTAAAPAIMQRTMITKAFKQAGMDIDFSEHFGKIPQDTLHDFLGGGIYKDGKGLSQRIWGTAVDSGVKIQKVVAAGLAQQMSATELSKIVQDYVDPDVRKTWDRKKQKEIFGEGYQSWNANLEYNALRLARTTNTHMALLSLKKSCNDNPFVDGLKWNLSGSHSTRMHGRTDICDEYARQDLYGLGPGIYPIDKCPFDHPNGMCYQTSYIPKSLDEIGNDLSDWMNGEPNDVMDSWAMKNPDILDKIKPKMEDKVVKEVEHRIETKKQSNVNDPQNPIRGNLPSYAMVNDDASAIEKISNSEYYIKDRFENELDDEDVAKYGSLENYIKAADEHVADLIKNAVPTKRMTYESFGHFLDDNGILKTQFEVQSSNGMYNPALRAKVEKKLFGAPIDLNPIERPVYGFLMDETNYQQAYWYGDVFIVFDKAKMAEQTTFTFGDSLDVTSRSMTSLPCKLTEPSHIASEQDVFELKKLNDVEGYPEIQIHGGCTPDMIKEVVIRERDFEPEYGEKLDKLGIKWRLIKHNNPFE